MRINELLTEVGDNPYPSKLVQKIGKEYKSFASKDGRIQLTMVVKNRGRILDINFVVDGSADITGGGDQFRIFSTALDIIDKNLPEMILKTKPTSVSFSAKTGDSSRVKLYNKYGVQHFNKLLGPDWKFIGPKDAFGPHGALYTKYQWDNVNAPAQTSSNNIVSKFIPAK